MNKNSGRKCRQKCRKYPFWTGKQYGCKKETNGWPTGHRKNKMDLDLDLH